MGNQENLYIPLLACATSNGDIANKKHIKNIKIGRHCSTCFLATAYTSNQERWVKISYINLPVATMPAAPNDIGKLPIKY